MSPSRQHDEGARDARPLVGCPKCGSRKRGKRHDMVALAAIVAEEADAAAAARDDGDLFDDHRPLEEPEDRDEF